MDPVTKNSKGFGFIKFGSQEAAQQCIESMSGSYRDRSDLGMQLRSANRELKAVKEAVPEGTTETIMEVFNSKTV